MGKVIKADFINKAKKACPWSKILHEHWPIKLNKDGERNKT